MRCHQDSGKRNTDSKIMITPITELYLVPIAITSVCLAVTATVSFLATRRAEKRFVRIAVCVATLLAQIIILIQQITNPAIAIIKLANNDLKVLFLTHSAHHILMRLSYISIVTASICVLFYILLIFRRNH